MTNTIGNLIGAGILIGVAGKVMKKPRRKKKKKSYRAIRL
jgi:hypothetical protein